MQIERHFFSQNRTRSGKSHRQFFIWKTHWQGSLRLRNLMNRNVGSISRLFFAQQRFQLNFFRLSPLFLPNSISWINDCVCMVLQWDVVEIKAETCDTAPCERADYVLFLYMLERNWKSFLRGAQKVMKSWLCYLGVNTWGTARQQQQQHHGLCSISQFLHSFCALCVPFYIFSLAALVISCATNRINL